MIKKIYFLVLLFISLIGFSQTPIITKWNTNANNDNSNQIKIPTLDGANYTYEFQNANNPTIIGSGIVTPVGSMYNVATITFPQAGEYILRIYPYNWFAFYFEAAGMDVNEKKKLSQVIQWGNVVWNPNLSWMFSGCSNLQIVATDTPNFASVWNMSRMFAGCSSINNIPNIGTWSTSSVTTMSGMFSGATNFNQSLDTWNTSAVTTMSMMFAGATNFNQSIANWNTQSVTDMSYMFTNATSFNQPIGNWNTSMVTDMSQMFSGAISFNQPIGNWNTGNVTNMFEMFKSNAFNQPLNNWNTANVTNMVQMFWNNTAFNQNIQNWNISNVTSFQNMFSNSVFNQPLNNWNVLNASSLSGMFSGAINFNQPLNNWNVSNIINMGYLFDNATSFNQSLSSWVLNPNVNLNNTLSNSGMDCENYSKTLKGWSENASTPNNKSVGAIGRNYGSYGQTFRNQLITNKGWTFSGDIYNSTCDATLSTSDLIANDEFEIFPNPVKDVLHFKTKERIVKAEVYDLSGRIVRSSGVSQNSVYLSELPKGNYLVRIYTKDQIIIKKLIKE